MGKILNVVKGVALYGTASSAFDRGAAGELPDYRYLQNNQWGEVYREYYNKGQEVSIKASLAGGLKKVNKALGD